MKRMTRVTRDVLATSPIAGPRRHLPGPRLVRTTNGVRHNLGVADRDAATSDGRGWGRDSLTDDFQRPAARYDGYAGWYDANLGPIVDAAGRELLALLGSGPGRCLDLAGGTGVNLPRLTEADWSVVGVDLSSDQLRIARERAPEGVELARNLPGQPPELHRGYRSTGWTKEGFGDGIRRRTGARHVPLAELLNAFLAAGLRLMRVTEAGDEDFPARIGILAERPR
jgi:hypothetical protein